MNIFQENINFLLRDVNVTNDNVAEYFQQLILLCSQQTQIKVTADLASLVFREKSLKKKQKVAKMRLKSYVLQVAPQVNTLGEIVKRCEELGIDTREILAEHLKFWWWAEE